MAEKGQSQGFQYVGTNRHRILSKIERLAQELKQFDLCCMFQAISAFDLFLSSATSTFNKLCTTSSDDLLMALTCLWTSLKYRAGQAPRLKKFLQEMEWEGQVCQAEEKIIEMEEELLNAIGFSFPVTSAYQVLKPILQNLPKKIENQQKRRECTRLLLVGYKISSTVSLYPPLGLQFYRIVFLGKGYTQFGKEVYDKCSRKLQRSLAQASPPPQ